ncbi:hypothetical protein RESH_03992 [Rhodopirellula europaea SH398]|uniref:Uncharacterized protein n=1 Tax=Rhodopirellula europaea SH398 TaxID=1263868 RepID=M5SCT6_9BACT|nr:hypothetical protein RESH_03992 [Rhodopirellula europaea SH398]
MSFWRTEVPVVAFRADVALLADSEIWRFLSESARFFESRFESVL